MKYLSDKHSAGTYLGFAGYCSPVIYVTIWDFFNYDPKLVVVFDTSHN